MSANEHSPASATTINPATEQDRGRQRIRRVNLTALASVGFRGAVLLSSFLLIPAAVQYLGEDRYGLWVALTSVMTLLAFADCGLGFSLMNDVARAIGRGAEASLRVVISTTFFSLAAIGVFGSLLFIAVYPVIPWQTLFHAKTALEATEAAHATGVIVIGFLLTLPFTTVQRVQSAYQEGYKTQAWEISGALLSLFALLAAIQMQADMPTLALAFSAGPLLATVLNWTVHFGFSARSQWPRLCHFDLCEARRIGREGSYFLILQLAGIAFFSIDSFLLLYYFDPASFGKYSLVAKLFQVAPAIAGVWLAALWPAYAEAIARGDMQWVRRTLKRSSVIASMGCGIVSGVVALLSVPLIQLWTGVTVSPTPWLLAGLTLYSAILVGTSAISMYLNGSNYIKKQTILIVIHTAVCVVLKVWLCKYGDISGAIWGANISYLLIIFPAYYLIVPRLLKEQSARHQASRIPT
jgi:O-antigen/teichoic acid export membrane protein